MAYMLMPMTKLTKMNIKNKFNPNLNLTIRTLITQRKINKKLFIKKMIWKCQGKMLMERLK